MQRTVLIETQLASAATSIASTTCTFNSTTHKQPQVGQATLSTNGPERSQPHSLASASASASPGTTVSCSRARQEVILDSKEVRAEYKAALTCAGLRNLRFRDLRHTFGTRAVEQAESILELKEWMGHASVQTTMRYLHYKSKAGAAQRLAVAFASENVAAQGSRLRDRLSRAQPLESRRRSSA